MLVLDEALACLMRVSRAGEARSRGGQFIRMAQCQAVRGCCDHPFLFISSSLHRTVSKSRQGRSEWAYCSLVVLTSTSASSERSHRISLVILRYFRTNAQETTRHEIPPTRHHTCT